MNDTSLPSGPDFEIALRYLDGDLPETDQMLFEIRLSENPQLAAQFERLHALNAVQRDFAADADMGGPGISPLLSVTRSSRDQLAFAATLTIIGLGGMLGWRILGPTPPNHIDTKTASITDHERNNGEVDIGGPTRGDAALGQSKEGDQTSAPNPLRLFIVGFPQEGPPVRLLPSPRPSSAPKETSGPAYRPIESGAHVNEITAALARGEFAWPAAARGIPLLLVGPLPGDEPQFLNELDTRLGTPDLATQLRVQEWLVTTRRGALKSKLTVFELKKR